MENHTAADKAMAREDFQHKWTAPGPKFTAAPAEARDWSGGEPVHAGQTQRLPAEVWRAQPATEAGVQLPLPGPRLAGNDH